MDYSAQDDDYFNRRAEIQLELAQKTEHPAAVAAHYAIANHYLELSTAAEETADAAN